MDALTVAKEITLAVIEKHGLLMWSPKTPEESGELAGKVFKTVLQQVNQGIDEANKI